ncbi:MAG: hypothetical protein V4640_07340 [Verrucomicrobiota bacterium]
MKPLKLITVALCASAIGVLAGFYLGLQQAKLAISANPYSDQLLPAHHELTTARKKLQAGDANVLDHIQKAETHLNNAEEWSRQFTGMRGSPQQKQQTEQGRRGDGDKPSN